MCAWPKQPISFKLIHPLPTNFYAHHRVLEQLRNDKVIRSPLEAYVSLSLTPRAHEVLSALHEGKPMSETSQLNDLFTTSYTAVERVDAPKTGVRASGLPLCLSSLATCLLRTLYWDAAVLSFVSHARRKPSEYLPRFPLPLPQGFLTRIAQCRIVCTPSGQYAYYAQRTCLPRTHMHRHGILCACGH